MHESVLHWFESQIAIEPGLFRGAGVVEFGAFDVNGSVRPAIEAAGAREYVGVDLAPGPGVNVVADVCDESTDLGVFDVVVSTEMLEHVRDWRPAVWGLRRHVADGGYLIVTTRSVGFPYHAYPDDHWRYSVEQMRQIFQALGTAGDLQVFEDPQAPGVFARGRAVVPPDWDALGAIHVTRMEKP